MKSISQSMIKDFKEYRAGIMCGLQFDAKYNQGMLFPSSDVQRLGQWFEYQCTGAFPKSGVIPVPDLLKTGAMSAEYRRMDLQVENFKRIAEHFKLDIIQCGEQIDKDGIIGDIDIIGTVNGRPAIVDLKSTGLLYDKWNEYGWHADALEHKWRMMIQAVHYSLLVMKMYGERLPFYFWVFSNKNEHAVEIFDIRFDDEAFNVQQQYINETREGIEFENKVGWTPRPSIKNCLDCPLNKTCAYFTNVPKVTTINYLHF